MNAAPSSATWICVRTPRRALLWDYGPAHASLTPGRRVVMADTPTCAMAGAILLGDLDADAPARGEPSVAVEHDREQAQRLCQFYTRPDVALLLYAIFRRFFDPSLYLMIEPSAGTGAFLVLLPPLSLGFDIDSRRHDILEEDFLTISIQSDRPLAIIGNPPFGRNSNLAKAFMKYAAEMADVVAFILPRTARKAWFQNGIDRNFHLLHEEPVPHDAFTFCGRPYDVPAVFQIWERRTYRRDLVEVRTTHPHFTFLDDNVGAEFSVRRVGGRAGVVLDDLTGSAESHHFIRPNVPGVKKAMIALEAQFRSVAADVAANPSLARSEVVRLYSRFIANRRSSRRTQKRRVAPQGRRPPR